VTTDATAPTSPAEGNGVLIAIAIFKLFKATLMIIIGVGAIRYMHRDISDALVRLCHHLRADPDNRFLHAIIQKATGVSPKRLELLSVGTFIYAAIFITEGIGLLLRKRWAEWLTIVSGALLIPFEIYELIEKPRLMRGAILVVNIAIVVYLIYFVRKKNAARTRPEQNV
jgi:uncharacterized membrane protein (DUF2068 family)